MCVIKRIISLWNKLSQLKRRFVGSTMSSWPGCTLSPLFRTDTVYSYEGATVSAHCGRLTLWTFVPVGSLQLESSLAPLFLPLISKPLQPFLPLLLALPGHFVGWTMLWATGRRRGQIGRHAAHGNAPSAGHTSDVGHVREEAAHLWRQTGWERNDLRLTLWVIFLWYELYLPKTAPANVLSDDVWVVFAKTCSAQGFKGLFNPL